MKFYFFCIFLAVNFSTGFAIHCYECTYTSRTDTPKNAACKGPSVDKSLLKNCPAGISSCIKTTITAAGHGPLITSYVRACGGKTENNGCIDRPLRGTTTCVAVCNKDACNNSNALRNWQWMIIVCTFVAIIALEVI